MIHKILDMKVSGSGANPTLTTYIIDNSQELAIKERPMVIICPGGGYGFVSDREAEPLALQFNAMGFHAAVLRYSVWPEAGYPTALLELAKAMLTLRQHREEWHIDENKILVQGSSAGGHLAASYGCFWKKDFLLKSAGGNAELLRPNGLILSYPVITSGEYAHKDSFIKLLGERYEALREEQSLEKQVNEDTPKTFLWHTWEDDTVPVENSMLFAWALKKKGIPLEMHIYPRGAHGLSLGNSFTAGMGGRDIQPEVTGWIKLAGTFIEKL